MHISRKLPFNEIIEGNSESESMHGEIKERSLQTDILIVGAGGAGLRAAIEGHKIGAEVVIVSKGDFPSGCTAIAMGGMLAAIDKSDNPSRHFEDTIRGGDHLNNRKLVRLLVDRAVQRVRDLERYGTEFEKEDGQYRLFPYTGSSLPRAVIALEPYRGGYIKGLVREVKRLGIPVLDHVMIKELLKEKDTVVGAVGLELETDTLLIIHAKSLILATGGAGNLYHLTTNPSGITGDGYALAYKAGAQLQDMEFVQGRVCMIYPTTMRGIPPPGDGLVTLGGRFYNGLCERYMRRYHPEKLELVTRAQMAICAQKEIQAGRGSPHGGVFGDLSGVPKEELSKYKGFMEACAAENLDATWQPYEWAPGAHHFMGGVVINDHAETGVSGFYACGEVAAGIHGSNRLAANALTETQVFGAIAGEYAAKRALSLSSTFVSPSQINSARDHIVKILDRDKGVDSSEIREELTEIMTMHVGVIRSEDGLRKATQLLDKMEKTKIGNLCLGGERSLKLLAPVGEVENLLLVGRLITLAAMLRTETRGAHNREDYPEFDESWSKNIVLALENEQTSVKMKAVVQEDSDLGNRPF
jgi:fumarate reductase (CoM/CoB) subunit A